MSKKSTKKAAAKKRPTAEQVKAKKAEARAKAAKAKAKVAEAKAAKVAKEKERKATAKVAAENKQKAKHTSTLADLVPVAKEINVRLAKVDTYTKDVLDHRTAASIMLASAEKTCKKAGIKFKDWVSDNIEFSADYITRLVKIGNASKPAVAMIAYRDKAAVAEKGRRAAKKAAPRGTDGKAPAAPKQTPLERIDSAVEAMGDKALTVLTGHVKKFGMDVVLAGSVRKGTNKDDDDNLNRAKNAFDALKASEKMTLVNYAVEAVGAKLMASYDTGGAKDGEIGDMPEHMKRKKTTTRKVSSRRRRKAAA